VTFHHFRDIEIALFVS